MPGNVFSTYARFFLGEYDETFDITGWDGFDP